MQEDATQRILANPRFTELTKKRSRFAWTLSAIMLIVFYGYVMVVAFEPDLLAAKVSEGATLSIGIPIGAGIIILAWVLTAVYVTRANGEFEKLNREIIEESKS